MTRIGIISDQRYVIDDPDRQWGCESFTISPEVVSFRQIFHSAFATPARYLQEICFRLRIVDGGKSESLLVFNPLFQLSLAEIWLVLAELAAQPSSAGITVVADRGGKPLCYGFPPTLADDDIPYLALLSTVDADLDTELCAHLFPLTSSRLNVAGISVAKAQHNGFIYEENLPIYRWVATQALATLGTEGSAGRQAIPFAAIMPHHAGDILFFALAWTFVRPAVVSVAVNQAYRAIVADNAAGLGILPLEVPLINRSPEFRQGKVTPEGEYFATVAPALPEGYFYLYLRPSRDYNVSRFHLIDHFSFALGRHLWCVDDQLASRRPLPMAPPSDSPPGVPIRVLLFFDGGWTLKIYPYEMQQQLISLLHRHGYQITVLSGGDREYLHCRTARFESYPQLKALLQGQHIMVGMDSFPTHLAAHVLGLPTLCLFGSTRPENSNAPRSTHYRYLENGLSCRPCYGIVRCPLYGRGNCANFAPPETVVQAIKDMLRDVQAASSPPTTSTEHFAESQPVQDGETRSPRRIDLSHRTAKAPLFAFAVRLTPSFGFIRQIRTEFMASLKRDGWRQTYLRTLRYLQRTLMRRRG